MSSDAASLKVLGCTWAQVSTLTGRQSKGVHDGSKFFFGVSERGLPAAIKTNRRRVQCRIGFNYCFQQLRISARIKRANCEMKRFHRMISNEWFLGTDQVDQKW